MQTLPHLRHRRMCQDSAEGRCWCCGLLQERRKGAGRGYQVSPSLFVPQRTPSSSMVPATRLLFRSLRLPFSAFLDVIGQVQRVMSMSHALCLSSSHLRGASRYSLDFPFHLHPLLCFISCLISILSLGLSLPLAIRATMRRTCTRFPSQHDPANDMFRGLIALSLSSSTMLTI